MTLEFEDHPFWDFSLRVYGTDGVPPACLALQSRHEIDVNVMLFCTWIGESGRGVLNIEDIETALEAVAEWNREIVCGLRVVRNRLKEGMPPVPKGLSDGLRRRIIKVEVDCEHAEQLALAASVVRSADETLSDERRADDAIANVATYFHRRGFTADAEDAPHLGVIFGATFPELDRATLEAKWRDPAASPA